MRSLEIRETIFGGGFGSDGKFNLGNCGKFLEFKTWIVGDTGRQGFDDCDALILKCKFHIFSAATKSDWKPTESFVFHDQPDLVLNESKVN